jgi:hypothetical protein
MSIKQPILGVLGLAIAMAISLVIISLFNAAMFGGWVTYFVATCVPVEVVMALVLQTQYPAFLKDMKQPLKGISLLVITLIIAGIISLAVFYTAAQHVGPPTPMTLIYVIFAVLITFWFVVVWGIWPVTAITKSQFAIGLSVLLVTYLVGYLLFSVLFDFAFLKGAPVYVAALDPMGAFDANSILSFSVTTVTIVFVLIMFDFWPITAVPAFRTQPMMGIANTIFIFVVTGIVWCGGVYGLGFNPVKLQAYGSIGLLFGCLVPIVMFEGQLFAGLKQPLAGLGRLVVAALCGWLLPQFYLWIQPTVTPDLVAQTPNLENWLASALLAMTFPMMVVVAQYFHFWPLRGNGAAQK